MGGLFCAPSRQTHCLFRHTYATRLHEIGVDLLVIQGLQGHESVATTQIYTRESAARQRRTIPALEAGNGTEVVTAPGGNAHNFYGLSARKEKIRAREGL